MTGCQVARICHEVEAGGTIAGIRPGSGLTVASRPTAGHQVPEIKYSLLRWPGYASREPGPMYTGRQEGRGLWYVHG